MLPELDLQPLSLEDAWRLRVTSAQVYSIVKNRDVKNFERVVELMESVYRLLPGLVSPIKHMKIVFGLKTLLIMRMLRERKGMVETMLKINQFFPNTLPQYRDQCSQHDMFLMRKNHVDFRSLAQSLTLDRAKLKDYTLYQMEEQYGEHYAQKVEDRLLHYLNEMETMLPGKTHVEQILDRRGPVTEEERLLLEVFAADSASLATTLKTLLHCDVVGCGSDGAAQTPEHITTRAETSPGSKDRLQMLMVETEQDHRETISGDDLQSTDESLQEETTPPQYCSKHGRWVKTILRHCTDQAEEPSPAPPSPLLFLPLSSSSSDDLTPSNLVLPAPAQSSSVCRTAAEDASPRQGLLQTFSSGDAASTRGACDAFAPPQTSPDDSTIHEGARHGGQTPPASIISRQPPQSLHEVSRKFRLSRPAKRPRKALQEDSFEAPSADFTTSRASSSDDGRDSGPEVSTCTTDSSVFFPECSAQHVSTGSCTDVSFSSDSLRCESSPVQGPQLKMSLTCQAALLQSKLFQPYVSLTRLSSERKSSQPGGEEEEDPCCSFDPNTLYSSYSSSSGGDDSLVYDPDYKPRTTRKQLLLEYEAARTFI